MFINNLWINFMNFTIGEESHRNTEILICRLMVNTHSASLTPNWSILVVFIPTVLHVPKLRQFLIVESLLHILLTFTLPVFLAKGVCRDGFVLCLGSDSHCIPQTHVCDGYADCVNGTDELSCVGKNFYIFCCSQLETFCKEGELNAD